MINEFKSSIEAIMTLEQLVSKVNEKLAILKDNPDELAECVKRVIVGRQDLFDENENNNKKRLTSKKVVNAIVENIILDINPNISLPSLDSKEFLTRYKNINIGDIKLKVLNLINASGENKQFYKTPAEIEASEQNFQEDKPEFEELSHFQKIGKKMKKNGFIPGSEKATDKYE